MVKGKTLYLCDNGTCYCPIENCKCVDGKCTCSTSSRPPFLGNCKCGLDCPCHAGECGDLSCPTAHGPKIMKVSTQADTGFLEWTAYEIQYNKAFTQKKPLLIWIGETCDSCEQQWADYIHARLSISTYNSNSSTQITGPCVKVCKPGEVGMNVIGTIDNIPSRLAVTSMLSERDGRSTIQAQPQAIQQPVYQPQFIQPMMPMMGGFGGGMMGGGCFGGGCSS